MGISYIISYDELAMLAELVQVNSFEYLNPLPALNAEKRKELLDILENQGFIKIYDMVQIDAVIHFIIKSMANAELVLPLDEKIIGYCTKNIFILVTSDEKTGHKLRITPIETVREAVEVLAQFSDNENELYEKIRKVYIKGAEHD